MIIVVENRQKMKNKIRKYYRKGKQMNNLRFMMREEA